MGIHVDLRTLDPLHDVTPERVADLRRIVEAFAISGVVASPYADLSIDHTELALRNARVVVGALEVLMAIPEKPEGRVPA